MITPSSYITKLNSLLTVD